MNRLTTYVSFYLPKTNYPTGIFIQEEFRIKQWIYLHFEHSFINLN